MDYNIIGGFLDKFKKIIFQKEELKNIILKTIFEEVLFQPENDSVKIKNGCIYIQGSPAQKNEILIHKKKILDKLKVLLPQNIFLDIK